MTRFVVCLDGTWNNAASESERADGSRVYRPTNVLKVARAVLLTDGEGNAQITYYDAGVGAMNRAPSGGAKIIRAVDNTLGGALGAGFEVNIEEAYTFLVNNWAAGDELFVFGFSRGSAQARSLCRLIEWVGGFPAKQDAYYVPKLFTRYIESYGHGTGGEFWDAQNRKRAGQKRSLLAPIVPARIHFLGIWDTVLALGSRFKPMWQATAEKVAFHTPKALPANVDRIRHALAIDERRHDFQAEVFEAATDGADLEQRWFPGVHSNVGGGLVRDDLANGALRWMVDEAVDAGLFVDTDYLKFFRSYAVGPASKKSWGYIVMDAVFRLLRGFGGERDLLAVDGMVLDPSVITRVNADPARHDAIEKPYRPANLLRYLARHPELHDQLTPEVRESLPSA